MPHLNEQTPAFTLFSGNGFQGNALEKYAGLGLQEFVDAVCREFRHSYVAWAPELPDYYDCGGTKTVAGLRAESIAAGRLIKLIDGKYVAQGEPIAPTFYCAAETLKPGEVNKAMREVLERQQIAAAARNDKDRIRPRLTWADSKPFDAFDGFKVKRDTATPDHAYSHPLTRVADAGAQVSAEFGSAHILPKA